MADDLMQEALEVIGLVSAGDRQATPEEIEKWRLKALEEVAGLTGGEEAIAAANFKQVDAKGEALPPDLNDRLAIYGLGSLARKGSSLLRRGKPGSLPKALMLAVTPKRLFAFDASYRYSMRKQKRAHGRPVEVASWNRDAVRIEAAKPDPMSTLRIEPLDGGPVITLAGPSTVDDPWSLQVMALLDPSPTSVKVR
jgi:hypothetical protein